MKLVDCDISIRLIKGFQGYGITTIEEVMEVYQSCGMKEFYKLRNFGRKSIKEIGELIEWAKTAGYGELGTVFENMITDDRIRIFVKRKDKIKSIGKLINKVLFYDDTIDYTKLVELNNRLTKLLK